MRLKVDLGADESGRIFTMASWIAENVSEPTGYWHNTPEQRDYAWWMWGENWRVGWVKYCTESRSQYCEFEFDDDRYVSLFLLRFL